MGAEDCAKLGGELLHRGLLQQRYVETIKKIVKESSGGYVHIGLNDRKSEGKFKYVDGTAMTIPFIKFAKGQPDNYRKVDKKNGEDCVNIRKSWELNDIPCKGFYPGMALCEIEKPELSFKLTPVQAKFDIAQGVKDCAKLGGELLHRGLLQQRYIATIKKMVLGNKKSFVYVGLNDRKEEGKFTWIDSSQYTMTNPLIKFDKGQPDNWLVDNPKDGEDCVMIRKSFKLNDITCQKKYRGRALCEIRVPDLSFKLTPVQAKFDIDQGAEDCAKLGGELLHRGLLQQRYVETIKKIVKESSGGYVHIGLNDRKAEGKFKYVDGTAMTIPFIKFGKGQPDNYRKVDKKNGEDCVNIRKSWELNDIPCKGFYPGMALCEIEKPGQLPLL